MDGLNLWGGLVEFLRTLSRFNGKNSVMTFTIDELNAQLGSVFMVHTQAGALPLTLREASERPRRGLPERFKTPISLVFAGPANPMLTQDTYMLQHPVLGTLQWTLVPLMPADLPLYEALLA
jgi:hypothetical protein